MFRRAGKLAPLRCEAISGQSKYSNNQATIERSTRKSILKIGIFPKIIFGAQEAQKLIKKSDFGQNLEICKILKFWAPDIQKMDRAQNRVWRGGPVRTPPIDHFLIKVVSEGLRKHQGVPCPFAGGCAKSGFFMFLQELQKKCLKRHFMRKMSKKWGFWPKIDLQHGDLYKSAKT